MCDIRYASDVSQFAVIQTRFSNGVATLAMPWIIGHKSRELIFTGDMISAVEAERIGLVNRVFPKADLESEVMKVAKRMSRVALDSLDALQISVALQTHFQVRLQGDREVRRHMLNVRDLAAFVRASHSA